MDAQPAERLIHRASSLNLCARSNDGPIDVGQIHSVPGFTSPVSLALNRRLGGCVDFLDTQRKSPETLCCKCMIPWVCVRTAQELLSSLPPEQCSANTCGVSMKAVFKSVVGGAVLAGALLASSGVRAATVNCPNGAVTGRYVTVTNAQSGGVCYYQEGNLQNADFPAIGVTGLTLIDKNGAEGSSPGTMGGSFADDSTSGTWLVAGSLWSSFSSLYLGFHFGNGGGTPDSFVVQLQTNQTGGNWSFNAIAPATVNGLSNYYLFGVAGNGSGGGGGGGGGVPEPATLALLGLGLLGMTTVRRRKS